MWSCAGLATPAAAPTRLILLSRFFFFAIIALTPPLGLSSSSWLWSLSSHFALAFGGERFATLRAVWYLTTSPHRAGLCEHSKGGLLWLYWYRDQERPSTGIQQYCSWSLRFVRGGGTGNANSGPTHSSYTVRTTHQFRSGGGKKRCEGVHEVRLHMHESHARASTLHTTGQKHPIRPPTPPSTLSSRSASHSPLPGSRAPRARRPPRGTAPLLLLPLRRSRCHRCFLPIAIITERLEASVTATTYHGLHRTTLYGHPRAACKLFHGSQGRYTNSLSIKNINIQIYCNIIDCDYYVIKRQV